MRCPPFTVRSFALASSLGGGLVLALALLLRAEAAGLLPPGVGRSAADAYRELRRVQHRARLNEEPTDVDADALRVECDAVLALWRAVMG